MSIRNVFLLSLASGIGVLGLLLARADVVLSPDSTSLAQHERITGRVVARGPEPSTAEPRRSVELEKLDGADDREFAPLSLIHI